MENVVNLNKIMILYLQEYVALIFLILPKCTAFTRHAICKYLHSPVIRLRWSIVKENLTKFSGTYTIMWQLI